VTPDTLAALRTLAEALPPGQPVPVPREWLLDLLATGGPAPAPALIGDLTCTTAGAILGRHASTVRAMCERGELPGAYRQHGREWRIPAGAVESYRAAQRLPRAARPGADAPANLGRWRRHLDKTA